MQSSYETCMSESQAEDNLTTSQSISQEQNLIPKFLYKCNHVK